MSAMMSGPDSESWSVNASQIILGLKGHLNMYLKKVHLDHPSHEVIPQVFLLRN